MTPIDGAVPEGLLRDGIFRSILRKPIKKNLLRHALCNTLGIHEVTPEEMGGGSPETESEGEQEVREGIRILLAEDNLVNQKVAVKHLEKVGCVVDVAGNGLIAVEKFREGHYDLIFMDCQMPEMDGYEATETMREAEGASNHTPIIAMTANARLSTRELCLHSGMDDYMAKPIRASLLAETLDRWKAGDLSAPVP